MLYSLFLLSFFVFWLVSFPMAGFLLDDSNLLPYFLTGHIIGLFLIHVYPYIFKTAYLYFIALTSFLTFLFPFIERTTLIISFIGFFSAFLAVATGVSLRSANTQLVFLGLAFGNLSALALELIPISKNIKFLVLSLVILLPLVNHGTSLNYPPSIKDRNFIYILSFLFLTYLIGGLMYGGFMDLLNENSDFSGVGLLPYTLSVIASYLIVRRKLPEELLPLLSIISFAFSFTVMHLDARFVIHLGIYLLELGFGFLDFYLLLVLYKKENPIQTFSLGFIVVCFAILIGYFLSSFSAVKSLLLFLGNLILLSVLIYVIVSNFQRVKVKTYTFGSDEMQYVESSETNKELRKRELCREFVVELNRNIPEYKKKLSKREEEVLILFLLEKSYREIAEELDISVSSTREYINRALNKLSMDKEQLKKLYKESLFYNTSNK